MLKQGQSFGELALEENLPRTATIICKEDSEFLILSKEAY